MIEEKNIPQETIRQRDERRTQEAIRESQRQEFERKQKAIEQGMDPKAHERHVAQERRINRLEVRELAAQKSEAHRQGLAQKGAFVAKLLRATNSGLTKEWRSRGYETGKDSVMQRIESIAVVAEKLGGAMERSLGMSDFERHNLVMEATKQLNRIEDEFLEGMTENIEQTRQELDTVPAKANPADVSEYRAFIRGQKPLDVIHWYALSTEGKEVDELLEAVIESWPLRGNPVDRETIARGREARSRRPKPEVARKLDSLEFARKQFSEDLNTARRELGLSRDLQGFDPSAVFNN